MFCRAHTRAPAHQSSQAEVLARSFSVPDYVPMVARSTLNSSLPAADGDPSYIRSRYSHPSVFERSMTKGLTSNAGYHASRFQTVEARYCAGACPSVRIWLRTAGSRALPRQAWAKLMKNCWSPVKPCTTGAGLPPSDRWKASYAAASPATSAMFSPRVCSPLAKQGEAGRRPAQGRPAQAASGVRITE